ncbi:early nodulin-75-like [Nematolebias whitei]|uniref:early nodulin-75-like n=1 Tax=Nematolebias whitei TaxID=451745 RepID=UPI0018978291|nr:early nodulin-75-like [Nematolebias whitei]
MEMEDPPPSSVVRLNPKAVEPVPPLTPIGTPILFHLPGEGGSNTSIQEQVAATPPGTQATDQHIAPRTDQNMNQQPNPPETIQTPQPNPQLNTQPPEQRSHQIPTMTISQECPNSHRLCTMATESAPPSPQRNQPVHHSNTHNESTPYKGGHMPRHPQAHCAEPPKREPPIHPPTHSPPQPRPPAKHKTAVTARGPKAHQCTKGIQARAGRRRMHGPKIPTTYQPRPETPGPSRDPSEGATLPQNPTPTQEQPDQASNLCLLV